MDVTEARLIEGEAPLLARSVWAETADPRPDVPPLDGAAETEVAVIGGGFTGLSAGLHLALRGTPVTVLEAESPGWGASGRNGGQVIPGLKSDPDAIEAAWGAELGRRAINLAGSAPDLVFDLIERFAIACDPVRSGWIQAAHGQAGLEVSRRRVAEWQRRGAPVEILSRAEVNAMVGSQAYLGGLLDRRGGSLHPLNYARGLARAAVGQGAVIHGRSPVQSIERGTDGFVLRTASGRLRAGQVLVCTNGYTSGPFDRLRRSIVPVRSVQVATEPLSDNLRRSILPEGHVASDTRRLLHYFRLDRDGRLLMGGRGAYGERGIKAQLAALRRAAAELFPQLGEQPWHYHWGGFVAITPDHWPHLHELEPGITAGLGYNGRGVAMATAMGRVLADRAMGMPDDALDFPVTRLQPIRLHGLRRPAVSAVVAWNRLRDHFSG